ncbi:hypothetical protein B9Z19DRAFT_1163520 [Tuber borchii]|uniref:COG4 transport protein middle alpha-helical bundle domain-containing protein n=1 Tax=Tuber borchii TaxID=42251 RepID=A0A2T7A244_TUBBO|nr:hypothetical protein B9Z19DRAFT_1163520 [Tuber borchii]
MRGALIGSSRISNHICSHFWFNLTRGLMGDSTRSGSPVPGGAAHRNSEDERVDVRDVDILLSEIVVILGRWLLFCRFLGQKF